MCCRTDATIKNKETQFEAQMNILQRMPLIVNEYDELTAESVRNELVPELVAYTSEKKKS